MESSRVQLSKMELSRADLSKMETLLSLTNSGYTADEIIHFACDCDLCVNDVRPIRPPQQPRQTHLSQVNIQPPQAMLFLLKKCTNYRGFLNIPQIISLQQGMLFYASDWGKLRTRDKVTNQQAKKFFDDRKQKVRFSSKNLQKQRQSYVLVYKAGSQQVLNDAHYTKIINKRKNDPFWLEVSYSYRMPESRQIQPPLKNFTYVRTKSVGQRMKLIMEKVMNQVDSYESKGFRDKQQGVNNASMMTMPQNMQNSILNNSFAGKNISQQFNRMGNSLSESLVDVPGISGIYKTQKSKFKGLVSIKMMVEEIIAYLQVSSKTRVLEIQVEYTQVEGDPIILGIKKLTICDVPFQQECYLHDRFKPIDHIGQKQLIELKKMYDCKDQQTLWNVCGQILESCLQQRRIKLKIQNYKKPQKAELKQIYQKFFPDFSVQEMFQNVNWKNQLGDFMLKSKIKINKMIESDQGISILKRFGVVFFRTF